MRLFVVRSLGEASGWHVGCSGKTVVQLACATGRFVTGEMYGSWISRKLKDDVVGSFSRL